MDKLFEDDIKLFCVDVVLNHFGCLKGPKKTKNNNTWHDQICSLQFLGLLEKHNTLHSTVVSHMLLSRFPDLARNYEPGPRFPCKATSAWKRSCQSKYRLKVFKQNMWIWRNSVGIKIIFVDPLKKHMIRFRGFSFYFNKMAKAFWEVAYKNITASLCVKNGRAALNKDPII